MPHIIPWPQLLYFALSKWFYTFMKNIPPSLSSYSCQVLEATIHCEERGIFHRDIKSENIILDIMSEDVVKLTDFGLSSTAQEEPYDHFRGKKIEFSSKHKDNAITSNNYERNE